MKVNQKKTFFIFTLILLVSIYSLFASTDQIDLLQKCIYNCEYEKAITLSESILKKPFLPKEEKVKVYLNKGIAEFSSQRILDSQISFTQLLSLDNSIKLNPNRVSPKIIELFNELRNRINKNQKVEI